jgi:hypothetical protein
VPGLRVDVEDAHALGLVGPPAVLVAGAHVVGDDVEDQSEPLGREGAQPVLAAERLGDPRRVDDVVAVRRARPRLQRRREVEVADPQVAQVGHERADVVETQVRAELQAVRGAQVGHGRPWCVAGATLTAAAAAAR